MARGETTARNRARRAALLVAFALLFCHGLLGSVHVLGAAGDPDAAMALHHPGGGLEDALLHHAVPAGYFAVLLGAAAILLKGPASFAQSSKRRPVFAGTSGSLAEGFRQEAPNLPRGPTLPAVQVFRL